ncbi:hypothetical protein [Streptomyces sp. NRRL S-448]|uniref:hypothetical protein n=1 Tax=Streptomyces sp. NRRL S-448 TaxID=1463907 RepID=UPI000AF5A39C
MIIELDRILREIPAQYHRAGLLVGRLTTARVFRAESDAPGECPVPVPMSLHRPTDATDPRLVVVDHTGSR